MPGFVGSFVVLNPTTTNLASEAVKVARVTPTPSSRVASEAAKVLRVTPTPVSQVASIAIKVLHNGVVDAAEFSFNANMPSFVGSFDISDFTEVTVAGTMPGFTSDFFVDTAAHVTLGGAMPSFSGSFDVALGFGVQMAATFPSFTAEFDILPGLTMDVEGTMPGFQSNFFVATSNEVLLSGVMPGFTSDFNVQIIREITLDGVMPGFTSDFLAAPEARLTMSAVMPQFTGDISLKFPPATDLTNRVGGRSRTGIGVASWSPPVTVPEDLVEIKIAAQAFSAIDLSGPQPVYDVQIERIPALYDRLIVGGRDVTVFRGVQTPFPGFQLQTPLGYGPTTINFPQVAVNFEVLGEGELDFLYPGSVVEIQRVNLDDGFVYATDYRGVVIGFGASGSSLSVDVGGEAQGRAALVNRQLPIWSSSQDIGRYAYSAMKDLSIPLKPYLGPTTGIELKRFGGGSVLDYVNEILARAFDDQGQWTIMPFEWGSASWYEMRYKDTETTVASAYADDSRVVIDLKRDAAEEPNRIFSTGVTPEGQRVRNGVYPGLNKSRPAPYPFTDHSHKFGVGTQDEDTDTGDGITIMIGRLIICKYMDQPDTPGGYDNDVKRAVRKLQDDSGAGPLFTEEGPQFYKAAYRHNRPFAVAPDDPHWPYQTGLTDVQNTAFEAWVNDNDIPFDLSAKIVDYDMRGFWLNEHPGTWHEGDHFPDTYKTPYDTTFSAESQYATGDCPFTWHGDELRDDRDGSVIFGDPANLGVMDYKTWRALYDLDVTGNSLRWSHIEPSAQLDVVRKWDRSGSGAVMRINPKYDESVLKVDRNIDYGSGFTKKQQDRFSERTLRRSGRKNWVGTISFPEGGLVRGFHRPGDPFDSSYVFPARDLRPGENIWLPLFDGGTRVHVSTVRVGTDGKVSADVDTRARDSKEVWEIVQRNRESRKDPGRGLNQPTSSTISKDSIGIWDEVGGLLGDNVKMDANTWTVFPIVAGQEGTVRYLRIITNPFAQFVTAVFGDVIYEERLASMIGNPLTKAGTKKWSIQSVRDELVKTNNLLYVAGDYQNPCGYYPKQKSGEDDAGNPVSAPLTGQWQDEAGFSYHTTEHPVLYVAVYVDRNTVVPRSRIMWNQLEAGA
jgi:hypothetical protein